MEQRRVEGLLRANTQLVEGLKLRAEVIKRLLPFTNREYLEGLTDEELRAVDFHINRDQHLLSQDEIEEALEDLK